MSTEQLYLLAQEFCARFNVRITNFAALAAAAAASTAAGTRDRDTNIYVELEAVNAENNQPMVRVVRKGHGLQLENDSSQLTLDDLKPALDTWAKDARSFKP